MLARLKMSKSESSSTVVEEGNRNGAKNILKKGRAFPERGRRAGDVLSTVGIPGMFKLDSAAWAEVGFRFGGRSSDQIGEGLGRDSKEASVEHVEVHWDGEESMGMQLTRDGAECKAPSVSAVRSGKESVRGENQAEIDGGSGCSDDGGLLYASSLPGGSSLRHGSLDGSDQAECMVFEGGAPC